MKHVLLGLAAAFMLSACGKDPGPPGGLYDAGGFKLHIYCTGLDHPGPTVILEAGLGQLLPMSYWLQSELARDVRVCSYDRAGTGWSEESGQPHDGEHMARQLHAALASAQIAPPYVLAGHSLGGLVIRVFEKDFSADVSALAFLDPSHPDQLERLPKIGPESSPDSALLIYRVIQYAAALGLTHIYNPILAGYEKLDWYADYPPEIRASIAALVNASHSYRGVREEIEGFTDTLAQARVASDFGAKPLIVISAGDLPPVPNVTEEQRAAFQAKLAELHEEIAHLSTHGRRVVVPGANHVTLVDSKSGADRAAAYIVELVRAAP